MGSNSSSRGGSSNSDNHAEGNICVLSNPMRLSDLKPALLSSPPDRTMMNWTVQVLSSSERQLKEMGFRCPDSRTPLNWCTLLRVRVGWGWFSLGALRLSGGLLSEQGKVSANEGGEGEEEERGSEEERSRREQECAREESSQKVRRVRRGDVVAIFAGAAYWWFNDGDKPLRIVAIADSSNY